MTRLLIAGAFGMALVALSGGLAASAEPRHGFAPGLAQPMIAHIQDKLTARGYYAGPVHGQLDGTTAAAIRAFQRDAGVAVDGRADQALANRLTFGPDIRASAPAVPAEQAPATPRAKPPVDPYLKAAQRALKAMGHYTGAIDGLNGPKTRAAIAAFRAKHGLDGPNRLTPVLLQQILGAPEAAARAATPDSHGSAGASAAPAGDDSVATTAAGEPRPTHPAMRPAPQASGSKADAPAAREAAPAERVSPDRMPAATGEPRPDGGA
jgi:peptidoglycan hydrolase-like protein with peptidoglycan-binding domain